MSSLQIALAVYAGISIVAPFAVARFMARGRGPACASTDRFVIAKAVAKAEADRAAGRTDV